MGSLVLLTTGSTEAVKKMNLYDVAGNVAEWTNESNTRTNYAYEDKAYPTSKSVRGGACDWRPTPCYYRTDAMPIDTCTNFGFRPALILQ